MKAGIVIDNWKINIFRKHLDEKGYKYEVHVAPTLTTIRVECSSIKALKPTVQAANDECAAAKRMSMH